MSPKPSKTIDELKFEAKIKIIEAQEDYETQLYLETMPKVGPLYQYCYTTSNRTVPYEHQSVDAWLRAIIKHMSLRLPGHGGQKTNAEVITILKDYGKYEDLWIEYVTRKLRKRSRSKVKSKTAN
jgi:hypothetical protein